MSGDVKAVLVVVLVVLVPTDQHVGKARLADPRRTHDQDSRARIPGGWRRDHKLEQYGKLAM